MLGEPKKTEPQVQVRKDKATGRFQVVKLEVRIAPRAHIHGQGCEHGKVNSGHCG